RVHHRWNRSHLLFTSAFRAWLRGATIIGSARLGEISPNLKEKTTHETTLRLSLRSRLRRHSSSPIHAWPAPHGRPKADAQPGGQSLRHHQRQNNHHRLQLAPRERP